jgi:hypothetical protein
VVMGIFIFQNQAFLGEAGHIKFFRWEVTLITGFWLVMSFVFGVLVYLIIDLPRDIVLKRDLRRKSQEITRLQAELGRVQAVNAAADATSNPDGEKRSRT